MTLRRYPGFLLLGILWLAVPAFGAAGPKPDEIRKAAVAVTKSLEVQSRLRELSPSSRVVVLTSKDDASVRSKALDTGASAFFLKPVDDDAFLAGVESAFSSN